MTDREIDITARLHLPGLLPLLESGNADGQLFYVMPHIEGESLRDCLSREKRLPLADAVRIAREVAEALAYAHGQGVVHRDVKPGNILLASGRAVVTDSGLAKALTEAGGKRLTETGVTVGTPAYMSPEQAAGSKDLDGPSDLYSLGCVLYEMLAGDPPFTGANVQAVLARKASDPVPRLRTVRPDVPPALEQVIERATGAHTGGAVRDRGRIRRGDYDGRLVLWHRCDPARKNENARRARRSPAGTSETLTNGSTTPVTVTTEPYPPGCCPVNPSVPEQLRCGEICVDFLNDPLNCGGCGIVCGEGACCSDGRCALLCEAGRTCCDGQCVDFANDDANCGAWGTVCGEGTCCNDGVCASVCDAGEAFCDGLCADVQDDSANCGACGNACSEGTCCNGGACVSLCAEGQTRQARRQRGRGARTGGGRGSAVRRGRARACARSLSRRARHRCRDRGAAPRPRARPRSAGRAERPARRGRVDGRPDADRTAREAERGPEAPRRPFR